MKKWFICKINRLRWRLERLFENKQTRFWRKEVQELEARAKQAKKKAQDLCPHLSGSLGESPDPRHTSIVWHVLTPKEMVGICLNCGREFRQTDPDFRTWVLKRSMCKTSVGGRPLYIGQVDVEKNEVPYVPSEISMSDPDTYDEKWGW